MPQDQPGVQSKSTASTISVILFLPGVLILLVLHLWTDPVLVTENRVSQY